MGENITRENLVKCQRCGEEIQSYSPMRKWCIECRHTISLEQAKERKTARKEASIILKK